MSTDTILEARGLRKEFSGFVVIDNLDLSVKRGEIHALIGPNGAGKSTLFNLLTCFLPATQGHLYYNGKEITDMHPADVAKLGMVRSFQISAVFPHMTALQNVRIALQRKKFSLSGLLRSESCLSVLEERAMKLLDDVGLHSDAMRLAVELPYGRKRALEIATTLATDPEMLLLDEPTAGMGIEDIKRTTSLIRSVAKGRTVLIVEHNLKIVAELSDTITVLQRGRILASGKYEEVSTNPEVRSAYMGSGAHA